MGTMTLGRATLLLTPTRPNFRRFVGTVAPFLDKLAVRWPTWIVKKDSIQFNSIQIHT
jgi:hypothetical protein